MNCYVHTIKLKYLLKNFIEVIQFFFIPYTTNPFKNPSFSGKQFKKKQKALQRNAKGLEIVRLPLLETFRTFKGDIVINNIKLDQ